MNRLLFGRLSEFGAIVPLLLAALFFSIVTIQDQHPVGSKAAVEVANAIRSNHPGSPRVLIVVREQSHDAEFAKELETELTSSGVPVVAVLRGDPPEISDKMKEIAAQGRKVDLIASVPEIADLPLFADISSVAPGLGRPVVVSPKSYRWPTFLTQDNLLNIASQISIVAIIAIGMTMVIITGGIDLSVGSLIALSSVVATMLIRDRAGGFDAGIGAVVLCCCVSILCCALIGAFNGSLIAVFDLPPFIVTLAMMLVTDGAAGVLSESQSINKVPAEFSWLGRGADLFGIPNSAVLMFALFAVAHIFMSRMRLGRYVYAVGGNREAARLSGIPTRRVLVMAYIATGLLAGLGGVIMASQLRAGSQNYGKTYELFAITAVVVGGTSLSGGEGSLIGTLIGAFMMGVIANGMNLVNIGIDAQRIVLGSFIIVAALLDKARHRGMGKSLT